MHQSSVPKKIYSLWLQGLKEAPEIVKFNFNAWAKLNPAYEIEILDKAKVHEILRNFPIEIDFLTPQALSDVVRARLLSTSGGVWVDASVLPTLPLDDWLHSVITSSGFFAFEKPGPDRPLSSWFLAATKNNMIMNKWWGRVERFWSVQRSFVDGIPENPVRAVDTWPDRFPYFWFHYLFQSLVDQDPDFANHWSACAKCSADAPHALQAKFAKEINPTAEQVASISIMAPVHKLNWRDPYQIELLAKLHQA
jgi:hypothetical protein